MVVRHAMLFPAEGGGARDAEQRKEESRAWHNAPVATGCIPQRSLLLLPNRRAVANDGALGFALPS
jgi:hypothetical protein